MPNGSPPPRAPESLDTLYLIDGHAQIFRAYFAIRGGMSSPITGEPTNAIFGFAGMLLKLFLNFHPRYAVMAIDMPGKTFRDELYPQYKAQRPPPPADLIAQEQHIFRMTRMFGIPILSCPGAEADDIIATVTQRVLREQGTACPERSRRGNSPNGSTEQRINGLTTSNLEPSASSLEPPAIHIRLVSKDKDLEQLLCDRVTMFDIHTDTTFDQAALLREKGLTPGQVIDALALMGDTVDNVPGVEGIGPKTAAQLIKEFGSIDAILANLDKIKGKRRENIEKARDVLPLSRKLVTLKHDLDIPFDLNTARLGPMDASGLRQMFDQLGFRRHMPELERVLGQGTGNREQGTAESSGIRNQGSASEMGSGSRIGQPSTTDPRNAPTASPVEADQDSLFAPNLFESARPTSAVAVGGSSGYATSQSLPAAPPPGFTTAAAGDYRAITTDAELDELVATLRGLKLVALDTETIGLGHKAALVGLSLAWTPGAAVYIPVRSPNPQDHLPPETVLAKLLPVLSDPGLGKCGHNLKYDLLVLRHAGLEVRGVVFDSMIASHLLASPAHGLDDLAAVHLKHHMMQIGELIGEEATKRRSDQATKGEVAEGPSGQVAKGSDPQPSAFSLQPVRNITTSPHHHIIHRTMDHVPLPQITRYAADDAEVSLRLHNALWPQLKILGLDTLARDIEMPLVEVLADMQWHGIRVDPAVLIEQKQELAGRIDILRAKVREAAGVEFNIDSPKQLADVLFKQLKLPIQKRTKTGPSTDIEVLEKLADLEGLSREQAAVPALIVEYRQLTKLVNTYLDKLRNAIDPKTGRVHAQFHQSGAATGRLSSSDPNLQNIPIRTEIGRQIRRAFIADPANALISADYSQIELRILAHLSRDPRLIEAFEADQDIHTAVASEVFGVPLTGVTREQRASAKVINFGIVYGVTPYGLARRIDGLDVDRARQLIADYKRRFAGIGAFLDQCIDQAARLGYVTTIFGRRRPIREIASTNAGVRGLGERLAINSVVQGSAADLIKLAMVNLHKRIAREHLPARLLLQIHDELVLETPEADAKRVADIVTQEMEQAMKLRVPLKVEAGIGPNWLAAK